MSCFEFSMRPTGPAHFTAFAFSIFASNIGPNLCTLSLDFGFPYSFAMRLLIVLVNLCAGRYLKQHGFFPISSPFSSSRQLPRRVCPGVFLLNYNKIVFQFLKRKVSKVHIIKSPVPSIPNRHS